MAWLEAVLVLPGSTRDQDWWDSNVLLDRNVAMELEADWDVEPHVDPLVDPLPNSSSCGTASRPAPTCPAWPCPACPATAS